MQCTRKGYEAVLTDDPKRLTFLGIDLHSRVRRRIVVVLTYSVFWFAMNGIEIVFEGRQVSQPSFWSLSGGLPELALLLLVMFALVYLGIFRENGLVKSFDEWAGPFKRYGERLILETRDDWGKYLYGDKFDVLSPEHQEDVRRRQRPGRY